MDLSFSDAVLDNPGIYKDIAPEMPEFIILDAEVVSDFIAKINTLETLGIAVEEAVADVIMTISRRGEALRKINDRYFEFMHECQVGFSTQDIQNYTAAWTAFSHSLLHQIEVLGLYRNNYLCYQLFQIQSHSLILEKIQYPDLNDELYNRYGIVRWHSHSPHPRYPSQVGRGIR